MWSLNVCLFFEVSEYSECNLIQYWQNNGEIIHEHKMYPWSDDKMMTEEIVQTCSIIFEASVNVLIFVLISIRWSEKLFSIVVLVSCNDVCLAITNKCIFCLQGSDKKINSYFSPIPTFPMGEDKLRKRWYST